MTDPSETNVATPMRRLKPHLPTLFLLLSLAIVAILRYMVVRQHMDMGQDMANYLTTMHTFFGRDVTGAGLGRPPLIAIPLKAFTLAFGDLTGSKLLGVTISVAVGIPLYLIAKRVSRPWIAAAVSILFVLTPAYANMLAWGYLTIFGIFFTFLSVYFFTLTLESRSRRNAFFAGLFGSFVFGFHQLTAAFFAPLCAILLAALFIFNRRQGSQYWTNAALGVLIGALFSLPYVPVYIHLLQMQASPGSTSALSASLFTDSLSRLWYLPWTWAAILGILGALALLIPLWRRDRNSAILLATLLLFPLLLLFFTLPPPFVEINRRAHFFLYVPIWAISGYVLSAAWAWRPSALPSRFRSVPKLAVTGLLVGLTVYGSILSQRYLRDGVDFYNYLNDSQWNALKWIRANTPEDTTFVAYPEHLGWWIEGEAPRRDFEVTDRDMEANREERERALIAERLMSRNCGMENGYVRVATSYPYTNAAGNPLISVYAGGKYNDLLMFDDTQSSLQIDGSVPFNLNSATNQEFSIGGDRASMQTMISYQLGLAAVTQIVTLDEGSQMTTITYHIQSNGEAVTSLQIPLLLCLSPKSVSVDPSDGHVEIVQEPYTQYTGNVPTTTQLSLDTVGTTAETPIRQGDHILLSFDISAADASITLTFDISTTLQSRSGEVVTYDVPQLIKDNGIGYLAIDLNGSPPLWSKPPQGLEEWLNACPYYEPAFSEGSVRIYKVLASALP